MQALKSFFDAVTGIFRLALLMWFGAILLFGFAISALTHSSYAGYLWGDPPQAAEARAEMQERQIAAQAEADQRKLDMRTERDMRKDGWGNSAPVSEKTEVERRRERLVDEYRETKAQRDAGWGS